MNISHFFAQFSDTKKTLWLLGLAFVLYFPLVFMHYGADEDSYRVAETARILWQEHRYVPSRTPGFIVHEVPSAVLNAIGGSAGMNVGTLLMSLWALYSFLKLCEYFKIPNRFLLTAFVMTNPLYWVNSASTIDYVWAIALALAGWRLLALDRFVLAGLLLGLAGGARLLSAFFVGAILLGYALTKEKPLAMLIQTGVISAVVALACYIPSFLWANGTFGFVKVVGGSFSLAGAVVRFFYKNIYFWGLQTIVVLLVMKVAEMRSMLVALRSGNRSVVLISAIGILLFEIFYLKMPTENEYLLPILPLTALILGIAFAQKPRLLWVLFLVQLSYNAVSFNIARADAKNHASSAQIGFWVESGYLIQDIQTRLEPEKILEYLENEKKNP